MEGYNLAHFVPTSASGDQDVLHQRGVSRKLYDCHIILFSSSIVKRDSKGAFLFPAGVNRGMESGLQS